MWREFATAELVIAYWKLFRAYFLWLNRLLSVLIGYHLTYLITVYSQAPDNQILQKWVIRGHSVSGESGEWCAVDDVRINGWPRTLALGTRQGGECWVTTGISWPFALLFCSLPSHGEWQSGPCHRMAKREGRRGEGGHKQGGVRGMTMRWWGGEYSCKKRGIEGD